MNNELKIIVTFNGGDADDHRLDLYDTGVAIHGLAKALAISIHAFIHDGNVKVKGDKVKDAEIFISPSKKGSFEEVVTIIISSGLASNIGLSVISNALWDFIKWSWSSATNRSTQMPNSRQLRKILKENPDLESDLSMALERPLEQLHRPIRSKRETKLKITKSRTEETIEFSSVTLDYVTTNSDPIKEDGVIGHVSRYNVMTGNGRFYVDKINKIIPFSLTDNVSGPEKQLLTQSMDRFEKGLPGKGRIKIDVNTKKNKQDAVKRYEIVNVFEIEDDRTETLTAE